MYEKNDKRRLLWLIDNFLQKKIDARTFCDEFYYSFDLEINFDDLTELEQKIFMDISAVSSRFSEFDEDHKALPKGFSTEDDLINILNSAKNKLLSCHS